MAIDDPFDAIAKAYPEQPSSLPQDLALWVTTFFVPGFVADALKTALGRFDQKEREERVRATLELLVKEVKNLKEKSISKEELDDLRESVQLAIRYDAEEFNDKKRERYVKLIGNVIRDEKQVRDLASFIQDIERLGERDFVVLRVLNTVMNKPADPARDIHPNAFIQARQELAVQVAKALGGEFEGPSFSREEGYDACNRLAGFGLAHEIEGSARQVPVGDYCFRPSRRGLLLLKLLGEQVANADKYHI